MSCKNVSMITSRGVRRSPHRRAANGFINKRVLSLHHSGSQKMIVPRPGEGLAKASFPSPDESDNEEAGMIDERMDG